MPSPYYPPRIYDRYVPPSQLISVPPKPPTLQSFSATLFQSSTFPTTNLVSYWKLDEASGTRVDSFGSNHLTDNNTVGSATGILGNAAQFVKANSEYLSCASNSSLQMSGNTDFTITAWIKLNSLVAQQFISKDDDAANSRDFTLDYDPGSGGLARFYIKGGGTYIVYTGVASAGVWYFVVAWYDSSNGQLHIRVNDTTTLNSATGATGTDVSNAEFRIGAREYAGFPDYADATIDEVGIWKRLLTSTEITALYNGGAGMTYTVASSATLSVKALKAFAATLSRNAALLKKITDAGFTATLSFVGALTKRPARFLSATLSFIGNIATNLIHGGTTFFQSFTATLFSAGTAPFTDNFNRADGGLGANWTTAGGYTALAIVSNTCKGGTGGTHNIALYTAGGTVAADQYAQVKITTTGGYIGPVLRSGGSGDFYTCYYPPSSGNPTIYRWIGGGATDITATSSSVTPTVGDVIYFEVVGNALTMKVNGVVKATATDSTLTGAGYTGIDIYDNVGAVDDFEAGTLGGGGPSATLSKLPKKSLTAALSWIGNLATSFIAGSHLFTQSLTATLSSSAVLTRRAAHKMIATFSFIGATTKRIVDSGFTATLSFTGLQTASKSFLKALTATLSFVGAMSAKIIATRAFTATLSFAGASSRRANKVFAANFGTSGSLIRKYLDAGFTATLSFIGAATRKSTRALAATLSFIGNLATNFIHGGTLFTQSLTASLSFIGNLSAKGIITRAFTATLSSTATLARFAGKQFSATLGWSASLLRRITRSFSATLSFAGAQVKAIRDAGFSATLSFVGNLTTAAVHFFTRSFTATLSFIGNLTRARAFFRSFSATLFQAGGAAKTDNFNRANGPLGSNWAQPSGSAGALAIIGNQIGVAAENTHSTGFWSGDSFADNQYSQAKWILVGSGYTGLIVRADAVLDRYYLATLENTTVTLYAKWDGAYNSLASAGTTTSVTGDIFRLEAVGSAHPITLTVYRNGISVISWTSPSITYVRAGGSPGIGIYSPTGAGLVLDDWEGGLTAGGAVAILSRKTGKPFAANLSFSTAARKAIRKVFAPVLSFVSFLFRGGVTVFYAGQKAGAALIGIFAGSSARIGKAGSKLDIVERGSSTKISVTGSTLRVERTK